MRAPSALRAGQRLAAEPLDKARQVNTRAIALTDRGLELFYGRIQVPMSVIDHGI